MGKTVEARTTRSLQQIRQTLRFLSGNLATISVQELDETLDEPLSMVHYRSGWSSKYSLLVRSLTNTFCTSFTSSCSS